MYIYLQVKIYSRIETCKKHNKYDKKARIWMKSVPVNTSQKGTGRGNWNEFFIILKFCSCLCVSIKSIVSKILFGPCLIHFNKLPTEQKPFLSQRKSSLVSSQHVLNTKKKSFTRFNK